MMNRKQFVVEIDTSLVKISPKGQIKRSRL